MVACAHDNRPLLGLVTVIATEMTSMLVAWCHCNEVNRRSPLYNATSLHVKQWTGCTTPVSEANISSDVDERITQRERQTKNAAARTPRRGQALSFQQCIPRNRATHSFQGPCGNVQPGKLFQCTLDKRRRRKLLHLYVDAVEV